MKAVCTPQREGQRGDDGLANGSEGDFGELDWHFQARGTSKAVRRPAPTWAGGRLLVKLLE